MSNKLLSKGTSGDSTPQTGREFDDRHGAFYRLLPAEIVDCAVCGSLRRNEDDIASYDSDRYDTALVRHSYPRYRDAFACKQSQFQPLLRPGADVVEVGSHMGAFLETAEAWGWRPTSLDIGRDTRKFAQLQGGTVKPVALEDYSPRNRPDAIFIWNCFEQLGNPWKTLVRTRSLLARLGLVVLRVPNADFYRRQPRRRSRWLRALSYNNLLGFPYLNGYSLGCLRRLLTSTGFQVIASFGASLLTPPYAEMTSQSRREWFQVRDESEYLGAADSPWIEIAGRAVPSLNTF